jgi:HSP20 family molecular chaperone IbpA
MKGNRMYMDIGSIMDEIFEAARDFGEKMKHFSPASDASADEKCGPRFSTWFETGTDENTDYYPNYSYPPMNVYLNPDRSLVFEFALAGFDEKDISLTFQGDYMVFAARIGVTDSAEEGARYFKRRLKLKDVERQKYYVPADKFDQEKVKAVFRNGILKIIVPPKGESDSADGVKIEIVREGT